MTATVDMPRVEAAQLAVARWLKVGWSSSVCVVEHVSVTKCFKCLEHGHRARDCKAEMSRSEDNLKCGYTRSETAKEINIALNVQLIWTSL